MKLVKILFLFIFYNLFFLENVGCKIPKPEEWVKGRNPKDKLNLISWLIDNCSFYPDDGKANNCIIKLEEEKVSEYQSFDGFYNNLFKVDLGAVDTSLLRRVPPVYDDGVYRPVTKNRINPFIPSEELMNRDIKNCKQGDIEIEPCGSRSGKSALLVYFGQQVVEELLDVQRPGCPPEYFNIEIPKKYQHLRKLCNSKYCKTYENKTSMPILRSRYDQNTGKAPGNPRQQLNEITPWIDGGLIYGVSKAWSDVLRTNSKGEIEKGGKLAWERNRNYEEGLFPVQNKVRLPMANPPPPAYHYHSVKNQETAKVNRFFVLGNPRGNENSFLLSFGIVLFRWHNQIAEYLYDSRGCKPEGNNPHFCWGNERIFQEARKWTISTYQNVVVYDWLREWLGEPLDNYDGYNPSVDPQIEQFFQTAAARFGHTLVTPAVYMRDYAEGNCDLLSFQGLKNYKKDYKKKNPKFEKFSTNKTIRTCNIFWRPKEPIVLKLNNSYIKDDTRKIVDIDRLLMGMASQRAEREDNMIVEDLRGRVFGPLEFSRRDLMAINIQRGRDHGTPDYNTAREAFGLERIESVDQFIKLTKTLNPRSVIKKLEEIHMPNMTHMSIEENKKNAWNMIDVWTGGILETSDRPGPLFRAIIKDQFTRIRNADRFWFENTKWKVKRFSNEQIARIKQIKIYHLLLSTTRMGINDIQKNPFRVPTRPTSKDRSMAEWPEFPKCNFMHENWESAPCNRTIYDKNGEVTHSRLDTCWFLKQLDTPDNPVEPCTDPYTFDYFSGSEIWFIGTFISIGTFIIGIVSIVPFIASIRSKRKKRELVKLQQKHKLNIPFKVSSRDTSYPCPAREWVGPNELKRSVILLYYKKKFILEIRDPKNQELLRVIDFNKRESVDVAITSKDYYFIIYNPKEYDCVIEFESEFYMDFFIKIFRERLTGILQINETHGKNFKHFLPTITTKADRLKTLEDFFKVVFAHAFNLDKPFGNKNLTNPSLIQQVINTELTKSEFADALGMSTTSDFVQRMFEIIDQDNNGFISFREFLDLLIIFVNGGAEEKAKLLFEMYDIRQSGSLSPEDFSAMVSSMIEAANSDAKLTTEDLNQIVNSMLNSVGLVQGSSVTLNDFMKILSSHKDTLGYAQLNFSGVNVPEKSQVTEKRNVDRIHRATFIFTDDTDFSRESEKKLTGKSDDENEREIVEKSKKRSKITTFFEVEKLKIFWVTLYTLVVIGIFAERAYIYSVEAEHGGLRHIAGYGVTLTRGAASAIMFCYATLLVTMCRNCITFLRETAIHHIVPFDSAVSMHKYISMLGLFFIIIHVIGHGINFYHISTQTPDDLTCLFREYHRQSHILPKFQYWCFETITGLSGVLLVIHAALIYIFATRFARKNTFKMFWITHSTYPIWYALLIIHGSGRLVQDPLFGFFLIGPLLLFVLDKLISLSRRKIEIPVLRAELLPSHVTKLEFARPTGFDYKSGQWIRIACSALNSSEFHPFTISSAPQDPYLSVHVRAVGPFTANIRQIYETANSNALPLPKLYLDGPYGEGHQDWWKYEVSILVGGGIGVTPFSSILRDVSKTSYTRTCKKIYFLWVTRQQKGFEWFVDIIREVEKNSNISIHIFVTQVYDKFDMRTVFLYICERHFQKISNKSLLTGLKSVTHFGRPNFLSFFKSLRDIHSNVSKFGVFSCGPLPLTKSVDEACTAITNDSDINSSEAIFQHHYENF